MPSAPTRSTEPSAAREKLPRAFGHFDLLRLLAQGQRGDVYAAARVDGGAGTTRDALDRLRVVKILPGTASGNPALMAALQGEANRLVRRTHGNLVHVEDVGQVDDRLYFVTEMVDGRDIGSLLEALGAQRSPLPPDLAAFVTLEVAAAASTLRRVSDRAGGDAAPLGISPHSVVLSIDGDVKVLHYGTTMARALIPREGWPVPAERVAMIAPELATGGPATAAGDVYAVGALLWEMLVGRPLGAENGAGHLAILAAGGFEPQAPSTLGASVTPAVDAVVLACIARDPAARPPDCDELRARLAPILRAMGGGGSAGLGGLMERVFGTEVREERQELRELASRAGEARARTSPSAVAPQAGPTTLALLSQGQIRRHRIATPVGGDLPPGQVIPGTRYRAISKLGEGGMGTVYLAEHVDLEKKVALKVLQAELSSSADILAQFRQEARAASKIGNPFICDVTDFGEVLDGRVFFVMEYLDGQSLGRVLRASGRLEPARAIALLRQTAKALGAAHEKGIVHLDVKPDNVMLIDRGGRADAVKVVDFGIAGLIERGESTENVSGTPEYIAPERALGRGYDRRSDIYSMGALAYEILTGQVPFRGQNVVATLTMHTKDAPQPMKRVAPDVKVPAAIEKVIMHMLEKDPAARPQSMAEVEAELCEAQIEEGLRTEWDDLELPAVDDVRRQRLAERMPHTRSPGRKAVVAAAIVLAVAGVGFGVYQFMVKPAQQVKVVGEDTPAVLALLAKAEEAARNRQYTVSVEKGDTALDYIIEAEAEAGRGGRKSPGAARLRRTIAIALNAVGEEMMTAGLQALAITNWKEALRFTPDDADLQRKAKLTPEERKVVTRRARTAPATLPRAEEPAKAAVAATRLVDAINHGHFSEARVAAKELAESDSAGAYSAQLADNFRGRAQKAWDAGRYDDSRPYYELVAQLDPRDAQSIERSKPGARPTAPPAPAPPIDPLKVPIPGKRGKRMAAVDENPAVPRDQAASAIEADKGATALRAGRLSEAERAFKAAVNADPLNPAAVGGLAEVYFERAKYSEAMDYARRASRLAPKAPHYLVVMGDSYFKLLRYREALDAYGRAQALAPRDSGIKTRIERVNEKAGKK